MKAHLMAVTSLLMIFKEIPAHRDLCGPCGVKRCLNKCYSIVGCTEVFYSSDSLWCQIGRDTNLNSTNSQIIKVKANLHNAPCAACPYMSVCVLTLTRSHVCVLQRSQSLRRVNRQRKGRSNGHIRFGKKKGLQHIGVLTVTKSSRLAIILLHERMSIVFPFDAGNITHIESHGNNVYYCQTPQHYCWKFEYRQEVKHMIRERVNIGIFSVDEKNGIIFGAQYTRFVYPFTLVWKPRHISFALRSIITHLKTSPEKRLLYVAFIGMTSVFVLDYQLKVMFSIDLENAVYSMDIEPAGTMLYTTDGGQRLTRIPHPYTQTVTKMNMKVKQTSRANDTRVFATDDYFLIVTHRKLTVHDKKSAAIIPEIKFNMNKKVFDSSSPVAIFTGTIDRKNSSSTQNKKEYEHVCGHTTVSPQKVVIAISKEFKKHVQAMTRIHTLDIDTRQLNEIGHFKGRLVDLHMSGDISYRCQRSPKGMYMTRLEDGYWSSRSQRRLSKDKCFSVQADHEQNMVFFITLKGVTRIIPNLEQTHKLLLPIVKHVRDNTLALDKNHRMVFVAVRWKRVLQMCTYSGKLKGRLQAVDRVRQLAFSPKGDVLYISNAVNLKKLARALIHKKVGRSSLANATITSLKEFSTFAVTSNSIVTVMEKTLTVFCRSTLEELWNKDLFPMGQKERYKVYSYEIPKP